MTSMTRMRGAAAPLSLHANTKTEDDNMEANSTLLNGQQRSPYAVPLSKPSDMPSQSESRCRKLKGFCSVTMSCAQRRTLDQSSV